MQLRRRSVFDRTHQRTGLMMTPMVDVVLVILIFFMASTTIGGYEWFLEASVAHDPSSDGIVEEARFSIPEAVIEVDLVRVNGEKTMVYGVRGQAGVSLEQALTVINGMDLGVVEGGEGGSLRVWIGAGDDVPMGDVMAVHDAWNGLGGVGVLVRVGR